MAEAIPHSKPFSSQPTLLLRATYPWTQTPLIVSAPMRFLAGPALVHAVSSSGGLGFLGLGAPTPDSITSFWKLIVETSTLFPDEQIPEHVLPFGIGFLLTGVPGGIEKDILNSVIEGLKTLDKPPAAVWLFPAHDVELLKKWTSAFRTSLPLTKIWIQTGTVKQSLEIADQCKPDVLVIQGSDAGGHGLANSAGIISLLPEVDDALRAKGHVIPLVAAGGISDGRGVAAVTMLGASGACVGTRFLASEEAAIGSGYQKAVLAATDGGVTTARTSVYDKLRNTPWPESYDGRAVKNQSWEDAEAGKEWETIKSKFEEDMKKGEDAWGTEGRATTYAGSGVGLVREVRPAGEIVRDMQTDALRLFERVSGVAPRTQ